MSLYKTSDIVLSYILDAIANLRFRENDKLPSADMLAKATGTSIGSVREALQTLSTIGFLKISHGRGIFLTGDPNVLTEELLQTRKVVESYFARCAAENMQEERRKELNELLLTMDEDVKRRDAESFGQRDYEFHVLIGNASGNHILQKLLENIRVLVRYQVISINRLPGNMALASKNHWEIFKAISNGEPDAAYSAMARHIDNAINMWKTVKPVTNEGKEDRTHAT